MMLRHAETDHTSCRLASESAADPDAYSRTDARRFTMNDGLAADPRLGMEMPPLTTTTGTAGAGESDGMDCADGDAEAAGAGDAKDGDAETEGETDGDAEMDGDALGSWVHPRQKKKRRKQTRETRNG
jgi:hypothetical protein